MAHEHRLQAGLSFRGHDRTTSRIRLRPRGCALRNPYIFIIVTLFLDITQKHFSDSKDQDFTITFIAGTMPKPSVDAVFKQNNQNTISIPLPPDLPTSSDGSYHYVFSATVNTDCKTLTTPQMTAASLSFYPPGGGAPTASGSVVMICGGCGT